MRKTNLLLVHDTSAPPLSLDHLQDQEGDPRVRDVALAERLGFAVGREYEIRRLVERNLPELRTYGTVFVTVTKTSKAGGRPGKDYWLNVGQALVLCALSRTPQAAAVRKQVITVFMAYRAGTLGAPALPIATPALPAPAQPEPDRLAAVEQGLATLRADLAAWRKPAKPERGRPARIEPAPKPARPVLPKAPPQPTAPQPADATGPDLLHGTQAIADYLGLTARQAKHRAATGELPFFKLSRMICSTRSSLNAWLASRMAGGEVRS